MTSFSGESSLIANNCDIHTTINNYHRHPPGPPSARDKVLHLLAPLAVPCVSWDAFGRAICHHDTRQAIRKALVAWREDPMAHPVRWIHGGVGTGKTAIAQTMAKQWASQGCLAASCFFSELCKDASSTHRFHETIARQLVQILSFPEHSLHLLRPEEISKAGWAGIIAALEKSTLPCSPMVIIIDGLDVCHDQNKQIQLLGEILGSARQLKGSLKFLICSRLEPHLDKVFDKFDEDISYRILLEDSKEENEDLRRFLQLSLEPVYKHHRKYRTMSKSRIDAWPSDEEIDRLVKRANGQFLFAATVIKLVD
ncbi:hypothetical protein BDN72DRAFT_775351, partial [Pluteus cervinus]